MSYINPDFYSNKKLMVIPQDPDDLEKLKAIDQKTRYDVARFGIICDREWQMNTVANVAFECILQRMAVDCQVEGGRQTAFNFYNCFYAKTSYRRQEEADKEGNLNVVFSPGTRAVKLISAETTPPEVGEATTAEAIYNWKMQGDEIDEFYRGIDRLARFTLSKKYQIVFSDDLSYATFAILDTFFMNLFQWMLYDLGQNPNNITSDVNFNDNVEFHAIRKEDGIVFTMRPGMNAKLIIKSDETTEDEKGDFQV